MKEYRIAIERGTRNNEFVTSRLKCGKDFLGETGYG